MTPTPYTDRDALLAVTAPEPEYTDAPGAWQAWNFARIEALEYAARVRSSEGSA